MQLTVTGRHIEITDPIRNHAKQKTEKFPRYFDRIRHVEVIVSKHDNIKQQAEIIVHADGRDPFVAISTHEDLYACIDDVTSKIERQLHDHKEKVRNHKHSAGQA